MSSECSSTSKLTITSNEMMTSDVTQKRRSPAENAFYESFLLQSKSDVDNLYASNIYYNQKHAKEMKYLENEKTVYLTDISKQQKDMKAKMNKLQEKQEIIMREKRKQQLASLSSERMRPNSISVFTAGRRRIPKRPELRVRSESLTFLEPFDYDRVSKKLSRSTELLHEVAHLNLPQSQSLAKSCEDLSSLNRIRSTTNKVKLPSIEKVTDENSPNDEVFIANSDSTFVTRTSVTPSPPSKPKFLVPGSDHERRRGSLDAQLDRRRQQDCCELKNRQNTQTKWFPRDFSGKKKLPPI